MDHNMWWTSMTRPLYDVAVSTETLALIAVLLGTSSILAAAFLAWWFSTRSAPEGLRQAANTAADRSSRCELRVDQIELRQAGWKAELDSYFETVEDMLGRVEQKRKRAQSIENRNLQKDGNPENQAPPTRQEMIAAGRERLRLAGG